MSEDQLNNNMAMPIDGRESLEMVKTVGTGGDFMVFTRLGDGDGDDDGFLQAPLVKNPSALS